MIADGTLAEVPGIGETMHAKIVQLATTGHLPAYDKLRQAMPPGSWRCSGCRAWARRRSRPSRVAEDREPGRPASGGGGRHDRQAEGIWREDRGQYPRGNCLSREDRRADLAERGAAAGRADLRGGPRPSRGDPRRSLRQPAAAGRDDRRSRHPLQRRRPRRRSRASS